MRINGQDIIETDKELVFALVEPYWSAYKKYKWKNKEAGLGINIDLIHEAHSKGKKITAVYNGISYSISPVTINNFYKASNPKPIFYARGGVKLIIVPQSKFEASKKFNQEEYDKKEAERDKSIQKNLF